MNTIQSSNTTVPQIRAAHGCHTTAYRIATWYTLLAPALALPSLSLQLLEYKAMVKQQRRLSACLPACSEDRIWTDHSDSDGSLL
eukprot:COSAG01_NODE_321_length_18903_cov_13.082429_17_plen_85_part_00